MKDWRSIQLAQIAKERRAIIAADITQEQFKLGCDAKRWPPRSVYFWAVGVAGPIGSADKERKDAE